MKYSYNVDLSKVHPIIKEKITSPHFYFSEIFLEKRIELGYDYEKMAEISNINIKVDDYINALFNIESHEVK